MQNEFDMSKQETTFLPLHAVKSVKLPTKACKMNKNVLFANDSDSDHNPSTKFELNTNKDYAKSYNKFRSKELLKKRKCTTTIVQSTNLST